MLMDMLLVSVAFPPGVSGMSRRANKASRLSDFSVCTTWGIAVLKAGVISGRALKQICRSVVPTEFQGRVAWHHDELIAAQPCA